MTYYHMVCVNPCCDEHRHRWHPGEGHCGSCLTEENEGYGSGEWTFNSKKATWRSGLRCCCRDWRIQGHWKVYPEWMGQELQDYYAANLWWLDR